MNLTNMAIRDIKYLDEFAAWINKLEPKAGQWHAQFFPGKTVIAFSLVTVTEKLMEHVMNETIELACEALSTTPAHLKVKSRKRELVDCRLAIANILLTHFDHKINYETMANCLGWKSHCSMLHARDNSDVKEVKHCINKVYSRYPFLRDGYKNMR